MKKSVKEGGWLTPDCLMVLGTLTTLALIYQSSIVMVFQAWQKEHNRFLLLNETLFMRVCLTQQLQLVLPGSLQMGSPFQKSAEGESAFLGTRTDGKQMTVFGYRWRGENLEYQTQVTRLDAPRWQSLLDPSLLCVETFSVSPVGHPMQALKCSLRLRSKSLKDDNRLHCNWLVPHLRFSGGSQ